MQTLTYFQTQWQKSDHRGLRNVQSRRRRGSYSTPASEVEPGHLAQPRGRPVRTDQECRSGMPVEEGLHQHHESHRVAQADPPCVSPIRRHSKRILILIRSDRGPIPFWRMFIPKTRRRLLAFKLQ